MKKSTVIKCPICDTSLLFKETDNVYMCDNNHSFDIAKQGYVNLLMSNRSKAKIHGDSPNMLEARSRVLLNGYYKSISTNINRAISRYISDLKTPRVLDIGCGIGYYLKSLKDYLNNDEIEYYGIDISKNGVKFATRLDKKINWIVGSNNNLPYINQSMDCIISVFSPLYLKECERVLKDEGLLLVVSPNVNHLIELKKVIYDKIIEKEEDRNEIKSNDFIKVDSITVKEMVLFTEDNLWDLFMMTPHYWKSSKEAHSKLASLSELEVGIDVVIDIYKFNKSGKVL